MDLLFWIAVGFIIIGFVVLAFIKRNMQSKKSSTIVWWIVGTTVWGIASIILIVCGLVKFSEFFGNGFRRKHSFL